MRLSLFKKLRERYYRSSIPWSWSDYVLHKRAIEETASFDVDCQKGFTPLCLDELPVVGGDTIVAALNKQATFAKFRVGSKDWHPANAQWIANDTHPQFTPISDRPNMDLRWKAHCIAGTYGAELLDGLPKPEEYDFMVYKGLEPDMHPYGACYHDFKETRSTGVIEFLNSKGVKNVIVGGLATDFCVKATVQQLAPHFNVLINLAACRSIQPTTPEMIMDLFLRYPNVEAIDEIL